MTQAGALTLARDAQTGFLTGTSLGVVTDSRGYSPFGELAQYRAEVGGTTLLEIAYVRERLGRITETTETIEGVTSVWGYRYDLAGRLEVVTKDGVEVARYAHDLNGNRLSATRPGATETAEYDAQDRLVRYGGATYTYTANGERATKTTPAGTTSYQYDVLGNLLRVTLPDGTRLDYLIDGRNRRVGKKVNGVLVQGWLYRDALKPVVELDGAGNVVARFVYGSSPLVPDYLVRGGTTYRIVSDHLGSPRLVVDTTTGAVVQRLGYDEFGRVVLDTNPGFQPFGFAGGLYDPDTGLVRFGARDYDAEVGRWTTKDPIRFAGLDSNLYAYTLSDPVNLRDPSGRTATVEILLVILGAYLLYDAVSTAYDAAEDLWTNYQAMKDMNTKGVDAYFHCVGNCQAARRGAIGEITAITVSEIREYRDEYWKGDSRAWCDLDRLANRQGREGDRSIPCSQVCADFSMLNP